MTPREISSVGDILQEDRKVEQLTPVQVRDAYLRGKWWLALRKVIPQNTRFTTIRNWPEYRQVKEALSSESLLAVVDAMDNGNSAPMYDYFTEREPAANVAAGVENLLKTDDDVSYKEETEVYRYRLKQTLRGCGTDHKNIVQSRVRHHFEHPDGLTC